MIAQEAGGLVTGSKDAPHDGIVTEAILTGRRYLIVRGVPGTSVRADRAYCAIISLMSLPYSIRSAHLSIHSGGEQSRRAEAHSAGIL